MNSQPNNPHEPHLSCQGIRRGLKLKQSYRLSWVSAHSPAHHHAVIDSVGKALQRMTEILITNVRVVDLRFPTSRHQIGSDAVNKDPDYSAAYCILETNADVQGYGLTFTLGRGNELCVLAVEYLARFVKGRTLSSLTEDMAAFARQLTDDSQFRWLGPEKGIIHLATGALINAVWDLYARVEGKPLWRLLAEMETTQLLSAVEFRYIDDALSWEEARDILDQGRSTRNERIALLRRDGYPAYTTSVGWFGFSDETVRRLCREALAEGWTHFKLKVGGDPQDDLRRGRLVREEIGWTNRLMVDANQKWGVLQAIERIRELAGLQPWWAEEPTSPDDILGPREDSGSRIAGAHRHRRTLPEPRCLQAAAAGGRDRRLPDRQLPRRRRERESRDHADGGEVRRAGLPACRRRRPVRVRPTPLRLRFHLHLEDVGGPCHRIRRSPPRALRRTRPNP